GGGRLVPDIQVGQEGNGRCELHHAFDGGPPPERKAGFNRKEEHVIAQKCDLTIPAHGVSSAYCHLLEWKQRRVGELQVHTLEQLHAEEFFAELLDSLSLS